MSTKVTIIIPVYKGKQYMREAIDSALAQTYKNLEILVINDGSPDNGATDKIAKSYGDKIKYIYKENGGVSTVLNMALKEMTGDYFSWLSHDDVYYPEKVEEEVKYLEENNLIGKKAILYSDYDIIDQDSILTSKSIKPHKETVEKPEYALLRGHINGITLLIPKRAFDECGNFDEKLRCAQDYELWYRMMKAGYNFIHIPKILAKSRVHDKQVTHTNPKVETEGNKFWIDITDDIPYERKVDLEGSEYNYYKEMEKFLRETTYKKAADHCLKKVHEMEKQAEKQVSKTKVSVILPFYNNVEQVLRAANSVLEQTHKNYELLLVNNGSKEDIGEIEKLIKKNKQIKLINIKQNKGESNAKNVGIDNANGDYIAFLDCCSEFLPTKIELQLKYMLASSSKIGHTSYYETNSDKTETINTGVENGDVVSKTIWSCEISSSTVMVDRKYIDDNNIRFDTKNETAGDVCFYLTILANNPLLGINEPLSTVYLEKPELTTEEKLEHLKDIMCFVLNNTKLQKYSYELAGLANQYIKTATTLSKELGDDGIGMYIDSPTSQKIKNSKLVRITKRTISSLKDDGLRSTFKKIKRKVKNKIKR